MTAHASSITEYGCVAISNNFTLGSSFIQYASTNSILKQAFENFQIFLKYWISWKKSIIWTKYFYCFSFHLWRHCQGKDSNTTFREIWMASKIGLPIVLHRPTCCSEKWRRNPVLPQRFFLPKKRKYCYSTINAILWEFIFCFIPLFDKCWFDRNRHIAALSGSIKM